MAYTRKPRIYDPDSKEPHKLSRTKIDLFVECPRCFYLDQRLGVARPRPFPFTLNNAVDLLLKKEFDIYRAKKAKHPIMEKNNVDAIPFADEKIEEWRDAMRRGIGYLHKATNLFIRGGIDDVWVNKSGELIIVDYKATSKTSEINLDSAWQDCYKRQMEIYQWLFQMNGYKVSKTGYFVYANGLSDKKSFNNKLEFQTYLIPYTGKHNWIEEKIFEIKKALDSNLIPKSSKNCEYCPYREEAGRALQDKFKMSTKPAKIGEKSLFD